MCALSPGVPTRVALCRIPSARKRSLDSCCEYCCELPLQDSNLGHLIQSAGPRATTTDKLTGSGVPTSIGALSVCHLCPLVYGEALVKCLQQVLLNSPPPMSARLSSLSDCK